MIGSFALLALFTAAAPIDIAVLPVRHSAEATKLLADMISHVDGVRAVSLIDVDRVLGAEAAKKIAACTEDQCVVAAIRPVHADGILLGSVDAEDARTVLRMRLIVSSTTAALAPARTTHDLESTGLAAAIGDALGELLPVQAAKSFGLLELAGAPPDAELALDGVVYGVLASATTTLRVRAGQHRIAVRAPGHDPYATNAEVKLGQKTSVELKLSKRRSNSPYIVGGVGVTAAVAGVILGAIASSTASSWKDACAGGHCTPGFTKQEYDNDRSNVDRFRVSANALYVISGAAIAGAVIWYALDPGVDAR